MSLPSPLNSTCGNRLGRSPKSLIETVNPLDEQGVGFKSLQEALDTITSGGRLTPLLGALAEFERNFIQERTKAGLEGAWARDHKGGRPKAHDQKQVKLVYRHDNEKAHSIKGICKILGISKLTHYAYLASRN